MTLDEAIKHAEEVSMDNINRANILWDSKEKARCEDCAEEHRQLAEWLKDYKRLLEQEQKTGHWEWVQYDSNPNIGNWHCSECMRIVYRAIPSAVTSAVYAYKYCPNCGARMAESEE